MVSATTRILISQCMNDVKSKRGDFEKNIEHLKAELKNLRTGRANASLVESITVAAYGELTPILHLASISVPDARTILITPWDKSIVKEIEKALVNANLGINPVNDGAGVRLIMPSMTEENRKGLLKLLGQKVEHCKVGMRTVRDKMRDEIAKSEKEKEITEDDRYELLGGLDKLTREFTDAVTKLSDEKEKEIMTI